MLGFSFSTVLELLDTFQNEQTCIDYLEKLRWNGDIISPFDPESKVYKCANNRYKCKNTGKYFNVKANTMFDNSKVPLRKWFVAVWISTSHKKGISSVQLAKDIGVTQKTAWHMLHRIRKCFGLDNEGQLQGDVEVDESYVGGKNKNRHKDKKVKYSAGRAYKDKTPVFGIMQRGGKLIAKVVSNVKARSLQSIIHKHVRRESNIHSDEWHAYRGLNEYYNHFVVEHGKGQYVKEESHCNTVEGFWSHLKRSIFGVYHKVSRKHLQMYVNEMVFRYNTRNMSESARMNWLLANCNCKLTYKELVNG